MVSKGKGDGILHILPQLPLNHETKDGKMLPKDKKYITTAGN